MTRTDDRPLRAEDARVRLPDPRSAYPKPPFPSQRQELPGRDSLLDPLPDHGEASYVGHGLLKGLATIVTGADSGIGKAVALAFAREGADVVIAYLDAHDDAQQTIDLVEAEGRRAVVVPGDLQDEQHCRRIVEQTQDELGRIDVLVNNAAYQQRIRGRQGRLDRGMGTHAADEPDCDILDVPGGREDDEARRIDHQRQLHSGARSLPEPPGLRDDQGWARHVLPGDLRHAGQARDPRECRRSGTGLDSARRRDDEC